METIQLPSFTEKDGIPSSYDAASSVGEKSTTKTSDVSNIIGDDGRWQRWIFYISLLNISSTWNHQGITFLAFPVDYSCARPDGSNISLHRGKSLFLSNNTTGGEEIYNQCQMFAINYTNNNDFHYLNETEKCKSWEYSTEYHSVVEQWDMVCEKAWLLSLSQSVYMFGYFVGVTITGHMSDLYGRRPTILTNVVILSLTSVATAFSPYFFVFLILRALVAVGQAGMDIAQFILITEVFGSSCRAKYTMLTFYSTCFGYLLLPIIAWLLSDWFYLQLFFSSICLVYLFFFWFYPESPRWLLSKGYKNRAVSVIKVAIEMNGIVIDDIDQKIDKISCLEKQKKESGETIAYIELFKSSSLRKRTFILCFAWFTLAFTYYGLAFNATELYGNKFLNFFFNALTEIPVVTYCVLTLNWYGRRNTLIVSTIIGGFSCLGFIAIPIGYEIMQNVLEISGMLFITAAFNIIYLFSAEIFPTVARNSGLSMCSMVATIGSATSPFMKDLGRATSPSVPFVLLGVLCVISSLLLLKLPETKHQRIPETLKETETSFSNENNTL